MGGTNRQQPTELEDSTGGINQIKDYGDEYPHEFEEQITDRTLQTMPKDIMNDDQFDGSLDVQECQK